MMKMKVVYGLFILLLSVFFMGNSGGRAKSGEGSTGAPGEDFIFNGTFIRSGVTCGSGDGCHGGDMTYGEPDFGIKITVDDAIIADGYIPNAEHNIEITVASEFGNPMAYGFQAIILDDDSTNIGVFSNPSADTQIETALFAGSKTYVEHSRPSFDNVFYFTWTADGSGKPVTLYVNGAAVNLNGESFGDSGAVFPTTLRLFPKPLDVELAEFKVTKINTNVLLEWITETETDNECFTIQHSANGITFKDIKKVNGAGNSTERKAYNYTHNTPVNGNNYYRLQMTDYEERNTYSKVEVLYTNVSTDIAIYPQPILNDAILKIYSTVKTSTKIEIRTISGQLVQSVVKDIEIGNNTLNLDCQQLSKGMYLIIVQGNNFGKSTQKFIKL